MIEIQRVFGQYISRISLPASITRSSSGRIFMTVELQPPTCGEDTHGGACAFVGGYWCGRHHDVGRTLRGCLCQFGDNAEPSGANFEESRVWNEHGYEDVWTSTPSAAEQPDRSQGRNPALFARRA